jgi:hypothetical protein
MASSIIPSNVISNLANRQLSNYASGDLDSWWTLHRDRVVENWYFYSGLHQVFMRKFEKEDERTFLQRVKSATIENHIQPIIDTLVAHLYPDSKTVTRFVERNGKVDSTLVELMKRVSWNHNKIGNLDDAKALNSFVTGYAVIQRKFIDIRTDREFPVGTGIPEKIKYGYVKKIPLDSLFAVPLPKKNDDGTTDLTKVGAILYVADYDNFMGSSEVMKLINRSLVQKSILEYIDDDIWIRFVKDNTGGTWRQVTVNPGTRFENRNPYRDVNIPFMVYKNTGDPFSMEGQSEVDKIKTINLEINELGNADKDTIMYHSYPILVGEDGATLPDDFARTKNAFVGLKEKGQKLSYLIWEGTLEESAKRQDTLRQTLTYTTGISLITRGFLKEIGQIRSGPPLKALFTSERAVMTRKFNLFEVLESQDMRNDLRFFEMNTETEHDIDNTVEFKISFNPDFLDIDKLLEQEINTISLQSGSNTLEEVIKDLHPDWTEQQVNDAILQVNKYRQSTSQKQANPPTLKDATQGY